MAFDHIFPKGVLTRHSQSLCNFCRWRSVVKRTKKESTKIKVNLTDVIYIYICATWRAKHCVTGCVTPFWTKSQPADISAILISEWHRWQDWWAYQPAIH